jgi:hypothetical protein
MPAETTPLSINSDGNMRIAFVPTGSNPLSVAILGGATTKLITYSLTPDGWNRGVTENTIDDPRLSLKQTFSRPGTFSETLEITYVYGDTNDVAKIALVEGTAGFFVERRSLPNATDWTIAQKVDVLTFVAGSSGRTRPCRTGSRRSRRRCSSSRSPSTTCR